jgi:ribosomal protein S18 acetylase RimI-like enzyme
VQLRNVTPADFDALADIDGTIESLEYLHLEQSGDGLAISWKLEKRPLRQKLIESNPLPDETKFAVKQVAGGIDDGLALLAEHESLPVGLLIARPNYEQAALEILDLRIDYEHRRQGLATAMIYDAIRYAREREFRAAMAHTRTNNLPANQFLLKSAFDLAGIDTRRYSNHDMVKETATLIWYASLD